MILTGHEDLRIQKTIQAIRESLKSLILEKEFSDIKVTALCQRAKITKKLSTRTTPALMISSTKSSPSLPKACSIAIGA